MFVTAFHGTDKVFKKFDLNKVVDYTGGGFGLYFSESKSDALKYGSVMYTVKLNLKKQLYLDKRTLTRSKMQQIITKFEQLSDTSYLECFGDLEYDGSKKLMVAALDNLFEYKLSDVDMYSDIIGATNEPLIVMKVLTLFGYNHTIDLETSDCVNYVMFDSNDIKIEAIENIKNKALNESLFDDSLFMLTDSMERSAKTKTLSEKQGRAKSKSQRRLMAMALAYKRGKLPKEYASDTIKKLSADIDQETLHDFASTDEKKRKKDGSIGKRNNIPEKVKKK